MIDPELARQAIRLAQERGATDSECTLAEGEEFSAMVRMRSGVASWLMSSAYNLRSPASEPSSDGSGRPASGSSVETSAIASAESTIWRMPSLERSDV